MVEAKVWVPDERIADFYSMVGGWLAGEEAQGLGSEETVPWQDTADDLALAKAMWRKFSARARALFSALIDAPEQKFAGEQLASDLDIPNGKYGVAGVLAWPGRYCAAVGHALPFEYQEGPVGESASYWFTNEVAALFRKARDSQ